MSISVRWIDSEREPQCAPDPKYPKGVDLDCSNGAAQTCKTDLRPYPTPRCGFFFVHCNVCGNNVLITTAGRPDDPRSVKIACHPKQTRDKPFEESEHPRGKAGRFV